MTSINEKRGVIIDSFAGDSGVFKQYPKDIVSFAIANDGTSDIVVDLGYCKVVVKPDEVFDDIIAPQKSFGIQANGSFRCIVRGEC
jgi:hypothetical protein